MHTYHPADQASNDPHGDRKGTMYKKTIKATED